MNASRVPMLAVVAALLLPGHEAVAADSTSPAAAPGRPFVYDWPQIIPVGEKKISTSITLRPVVFEYRAPPPFLAVSVLPGTSLKLAVDRDSSSIAAISWYKDSVPLGITTPTLEIPSLTTTDSGFYAAAVTLKGAVPTAAAFETVVVRVVSPPWIRLFNLSTRATLSPSQRFFISGFVISSPPLYDGGGPKIVLIRAIGPSLASYGIADPLAAPVIQVFDSKGVEVSPPARPAVFPDLALEQMVAKAGAFPIPRLTKDITALYSLTPDAYSVKVSSADGGSGTVLLEIYEVPE